LAAGKGSRFGRLGAYLQKCMYPVLGKPFLEYTIESLICGVPEAARAGRLTVVVGHMGQQIRAYFGDRFEGLHLEYLTQSEPLGTGHAIHLAHAAQQYAEPVTIWLADSFHRSGLFQSIQHSLHRHTLTIAQHVCGVRHNERVDVAGDLVTRAWQGESPYVDIGLWRFGPELLSGMIGSCADEWRALLNIQSAIEKGIEVGAQISPEWIHLGGIEPSFERNVEEVTRFFLDFPEVKGKGG
jgi:dTDP-glucose pyrophosphorylase